MDYIIKELIDKSFNIEDVYVKFHSKFTSEDVKYAIDKAKYLSDLFYWCSEQ